MSETTKSFNGVKLKVNFTAISSSNAMSNIATDENISSMFAKIHHWYVKTNGFQASSVPLVSTSSNGIVPAITNTSGFLKGTGTNGTWTTISSSDLPNGIVWNTGNVQLNGLFEPSAAGNGTQVTSTNSSSNMAQLGREEYPFSNIYGVNLHAATKSNTIKPSLNISWYDASGNNNGDWKFEIEDNTNGLTLSENGTELFAFDTDGTFTCDGLSVTTINGKVVGNNPKFTDTVTTVTLSGSGNAVTSITDDGNGNITATKGSTFLTAHPTITTQTDTTSTASPAHGGTFTAIDSVTRDTNGHVTKVNTKTVTLPAQYSHPSYNTSTNQSSENLSFGGSFKTLYSLNYSNGHVTYLDYKTYTLPTLPTASTSTAGIVKLSSSTSSTSTSLAATPSAVKSAYDLANNFITNYNNNHLVEISYFPSYKRYDKSGSTPVVREVFRFNAVSSTSGVTITECGCVFYRSTTATSDEPDTQTLSCELLKTDANSSTGVTLATSNFTNKTMYSPSIGYNSDTISIFVRPWFDYTYNGTTYTAYGDIIRANIGAGFLMDSTDGCWRNINESGYPKFITEDDLGSAAYTSSTAYASSSHTHSYIPLSGSSAITGNLEITKATGQVGFYATRVDTSARLFFGLGDSGTFGGICAYPSNAWVFFHDGRNTAIPRINDGSITISDIAVPTSTGSFLVTGNTSFSSSLTSGTKIGTITIGGTATDLYCQTNTDTKVTDTVGTANTYYPAGLTATSTTTGTQVFDTSLKFIGTTGSTSAVGKAQLVLGNATASGTANNKQGSIVVYGSTAYAHTIQGAPTAARTLTLPNATGTLALTSDIPTVSVSRNLTSGTKVGTITINGTATDLYCQTNTDASVKQSSSTSDTYRSLVLGNKYSSTAGASTLSETVTGQVYTNSGIYANPSTGRIYATGETGNVGALVTREDVHGTLFSKQSITRLPCMHVAAKNASSSSQYFLIATCTSLSSITNNNMTGTFLIESANAINGTSSNYDKGGAGILHVDVRIQATAGTYSGTYFKWPMGCITGGGTYYLAIYNNTYYDGSSYSTKSGYLTYQIYYKPAAQYYDITATLLSYGICSGSNPDNIMKWYLNMNSTDAGVTSMSISTKSPDTTKEDVGGRWDNLTISSSSITISDSEAKYRVSGDIVEVYMKLAVSTTSAGFSSITTLPIWVRPSFQRYIGIIPNQTSGASSSQVMACAQISTAGVISIASNSSSTFSSGKTYYLNFMFIQ